MNAPVYRFEGKIIRVCFDGWMYELPSPTAHNYEGRGLDPRERDKVTAAIASGTAQEI